MSHRLRRSTALKQGFLAVVSLSLWSQIALQAVEPTPATGANVDESRVQQTLYVDAANGDAADDDKHGTSEVPFATIAYACGVAERAKDANRGVKILIGPGTYRETAEIHPPATGKPDTDAPLVIEAAEHDQTVIDGADAEGWTPSTWKEEEGRWTHPWPESKVVETPHPTRQGTHNKAPAAPSSPAYESGKLLVVNGGVLREVNSLADLQPGTFWIRWAAPPPAPSRHAAPAAPSEEGNGSSVIVFPPEDTPLADAIIQVGMRSSGLVIDGRRNVVVRGLLIEHTATPGGNSLGVNIAHCNNVLVEDLLSQWNDGFGLLIGHGSDVTLRRVRALHNGTTGLAVADGHNVLAEDGEASFNNFRGEWAGVVEPFRPVGVVAQQVAGSTWRRQRVVSNAGRGMWFVEDSNLGVEEAVVRANVISGLLLDSSGGPTLIHRSLVVGTKLPPGTIERGAEPAAVSIDASPDVTFDSNVIVANAAPALGLRNSLPGAAPFTNRKTGPATVLRSERHVFHHNLVAGLDAGQTLSDWPVADHLGSIDFTKFYVTLKLDENCFWNPVATEVFGTYDKAETRRPGLNLNGWLAFLSVRAGGGSEASSSKSIWQDPLFVDPGEGDYRLQENSPVKDWNLLVDDNSAGQ